MNITMTCACGESFETEAEAEVDVLLNGEGGKWTNVVCPLCGEKYIVKLTVEFGNV